MPRTRQDDPEVEQHVDTYVPVPIDDVYDDYVEGDHPTENPDGVTNSIPDYTPKTQEEKAALLNVGMVETIDTGLEGYPVDEGRDLENEFYQAHGFRREEHGDEDAPLPNEPEGGFYAAHGYIRRDDDGDHTARSRQGRRGGHRSGSELNRSEELA